MSRLRIRCRLSAPADCEWVSVDGSVTNRGVGTLRDAAGSASSIELVIAAEDVLITRTVLPPTARRRAGATLAYAVEEHTLGEPEAQHVTWLGRDGTDDVLAVIDRTALESCIAALREASRVRVDAYCETLLLPRADSEWSLAWNGREGFVRTGTLEGAATDAGDAHTSPLALQLLVEDALRRGAMPAGIAVYVTAHDVTPDIAAWQEALDVPLRLAGVWDPLVAPMADSARIAVDAGRRADAPSVVSRFRPALWLAMAALAIQTLAVIADWAWHASEERTLRARMDERFRAAFPEAISVVDPALQMRRKLAEARHAVSLSDESDFVPLIAQVAGALGDLPRGALRLVTYDRGRLTLQLALSDDAGVRRIASRLNALGLRVEIAPAAARSSERTIVVTAGGA